MAKDPKPIYRQIEDMRGELLALLAHVAHSAARCSDQALRRKLVDEGDSVRGTLRDIDALLTARSPSTAMQHDHVARSTNGAVCNTL